jgi:hypothetical protein
MTAVKERMKGLLSGSASTDGGAKMLTELTVASVVLLNIFWWWKR